MLPWLVGGIVLVAFSLWQTPVRSRHALESRPETPNDFFDAWFPAFWAALAGLFGLLIIVGGVLRNM